ncbi:helix-turn-helix domain-containing protein [Nocardiopsis sp. CNT-189]|uniref:helix-turn-helix domain-containing protein n=1 Tax=Nocardiopsis oceanisediminis TaxID=2816862 RepID=UPI003B2CC783
MRKRKTTPPTKNPTVVRWQLAGELRRLRGDRSANEVAKALRMTPSIVFRWETAGSDGVVPASGTLTRLLEYYEVDEAETQRLMALRDEARSRGWWQPYDLDKHYGTLIGLEANASEIEAFDPQLVPGLLQTEDYMRAVIKGTRPDIDPTTLEQRVNVRLQRQRTWEEGSTELWLIVGEAALRQLIGGPPTMHEQLTRLLELSEHPRITLQAVPFSEGAHPGLETSGFLILRLSEISLTAVYVEGRTSNLYLDSEEDIETYEKVFDNLRAAAAGVQSTTSLISSIRHGLRKE